MESDTMNDRESRLAAPDVDALKNHILNSFRVRENQSPVYVDLGGNLGRISAPQHQVIFGRRGSGKSCLFIHYLKSHQKDRAPPPNIRAL
jgi:hypothetical protein